MTQCTNELNVLCGSCNQDCQRIRPDGALLLRLQSFLPSFQKFHIHSPSCIRRPEPSTNARPNNRIQYPVCPIPHGQSYRLAPPRRLRSIEEQESARAEGIERPEDVRGHICTSLAAANQRETEVDEEAPELVGAFVWGIGADASDEEVVEVVVEGSVGGNMRLIFSRCVNRVCVRKLLTHRT